jgi:hypothetical protein
MIPRNADNPCRLNFLVEWATPLPPFLITPIFLPISCSITTNFSLLFDCFFFFGRNRGVWRNKKNSVFVTPACVGVYNVSKWHA